MGLFSDTLKASLFYIPSKKKKKTRKGGYKYQTLSKSKKTKKFSIKKFKKEKMERKRASSPSKDVLFL